MFWVPSSPRPPRREQSPSVSLLGGSGIFTVFVTVAIRLLRNVFVAKAVSNPSLRRRDGRSPRPPSSVGIVGAVGCVPQVMPRHHREGGNDLLAPVLLAGVLRVGVGAVVPVVVPAGALAHRGVGRVVRRRDDARRGGGIGGQVARMVDGGLAVVGAHRGHGLRRRGLSVIVVALHRSGRRRRVEFAPSARLLRAGIVGRDLLRLPRGTRGGDGAATESRAMGIVTPIVVPMMMGGVRPPLSCASGVVGAMMLANGTAIDGLGSARLDLALLPVDEDVTGLSRDGR